MTDRLKGIIFNKLITDLSGVEMIIHNNSIWFIDRENKYWYLELVNDGKLYWRYQFFFQFFSLFSMDREEFEPLIKEWVELVLNNGVTSMHSMNITENKLMESALNNGITSSGWMKSIPFDRVESSLNNGITSSHLRILEMSCVVESALKNGITSSRPAKKSLTIVESVLNNE